MRKQLIREHSVSVLVRFFTLNALILAVFLAGYLPILWQQEVSIAITFFSLIGQAVLFVSVPTFILLMIVFLAPHLRWLIYIFSVIVSSSLLIFALIDLIAYHLYEFHVLSLLWNMFKSGVMNQILTLSISEWMIFSVVVLVIIVLEILILGLYVHRSYYKKITGFEKLFVLILLFIPVSSYVITADQLRDSRRHLIPTVQDISLQNQLRIIPYYHVLAQRLLPNKILEPKTRVLQYPLYPLNYASAQHPQNIVFIFIDTWRYDAFNQTDTPDIWEFAQHAWQFDNHYSGGNFTEPGIFSAFYSIPPVYWNTVLKEQKPPALMTQMEQEHYQMGIFASASLAFPPFDKTIFKGISNYQIDTPGETSTQRDKAITNEFQYFVTQRNQTEPFFSFLFYDEVHNWCGSSQWYAHPFQPAIQTCDRLLLSGDTNSTPYFNRYLNAVHYVDGLVGRDLAVLKKQGLLKNTIIVVTADHGEEFNDEKLGLWGHGSAYDRFQLHVPFILYIPNVPSKIVTQRTSHYDIVPTVMRHVLGNLNPIADYSVGTDLLYPKQQSCFWVGGADGFALMHAHSETVFYSPLKQFSTVQYPLQKTYSLPLHTDWQRCSSTLWRFFNVNLKA